MSSRLTLTALLCLTFYSSVYSQKLINGFTRKLAINQLPAPFSMNSFDATGDTVPELLVTTGTRLLVFDGQTFNLIFQDSAVPGTANLSPADVNSDGQIDLVSTIGDSGVAVWYGPDFLIKRIFAVGRGFSAFTVRNRDDGQVEFFFGYRHEHSTADSTCTNFYVDGHFTKYSDTLFTLYDSTHLLLNPTELKTLKATGTSSQSILISGVYAFERHCQSYSYLFYDTKFQLLQADTSTVANLEFFIIPIECPPAILESYVIGNFDADSAKELIAFFQQPYFPFCVPRQWFFRAHDILSPAKLWERLDSLGILALFSTDLNGDGIDELLSYENQNSKPGLVEYQTSDGATLGFSEIPFTPTNLLVGKLGTLCEPKLLLAHSDSVVVYSFNVATDADEIPGKTNLPRHPELFPPIPNPFNAQATIRYVLPQSGEVTLQIFDILGREVQTLFAGFQKAGQHQINWNAADRRGAPAASGIYFAVLKTGDVTVSQKLVLVK